MCHYAYSNRMNSFIILSQGPIRSTIKQAKLSSAKRLCEHLLQAG
jgi:hypothetical protein